MIRYNCPSCGAAFNARETSVGTVRRCPACGDRIILEEPEIVAVPVRRRPSSRQSFSPGRVLGLLAGVLLMPLLCCGLPLYLISLAPRHQEETTIGEPGEAKDGPGSETAAVAKDGGPDGEAKPAPSGEAVAWTNEPSRPTADLGVVRAGPRSAARTQYVSGYTRKDGRQVAGYYRRR